MMSPAPIRRISIRVKGAGSSTWVKDRRGRRPTVERCTDVSRATTHTGAPSRPNQRRRVQRRYRVQSCAVAWASGIPRAVAGTCPTIGSTAPDFSLVSLNMSQHTIQTRELRERFDWACAPTVSTAPPSSPCRRPQTGPGSPSAAGHSTSCCRAQHVQGTTSDAWGTSARRGVRRRPIEGWRSRP